MLVKDVMTPSPVSCKPEDTLEQVAKLMLEHDCGVIPVREFTKIVGMITDRDITLRAVALGKIPATVTARDVMTEPVYAVREDQDIQAAIDLMEEKQIRRLPVLDENDNLVGIIAPSDLAPSFVSNNVTDFLLQVSYWSHRDAHPDALAHRH
jgi:CBS domain-containing protein